MNNKYNVIIIFITIILAYFIYTFAIFSANKKDFNDEIINNIKIRESILK